MLVYNYGSKKKNEIMRESWIYKEKSWGIVTQPKGFLGEVFLNDLSCVSPSFLVCTCKKQQAKTCWKCCKTHPKCYKNFCFYIEILYLTLPMKTSQGTWLNYDPCRLITLSTHAGVRKFRLQNFGAGTSDTK